MQGYGGVPSLEVSRRCVDVAPRGVGRLGLDLVILEVFPNLDGSKIL